MDRIITVLFNERNKKIAYGICQQLRKGKFENVDSFAWEYTENITVCMLIRLANVYEQYIVRALSCHFQTYLTTCHVHEVDWQTLSVCLVIYLSGGKYPGGCLHLVVPSWLCFIVLVCLCNLYQPVSILAACQTLWSSELMLLLGSVNLFWLASHVTCTCCLCQVQLLVSSPLNHTCFDWNIKQQNQWCLFHLSPRMLYMGLCSIAFNISTLVVCIALPVF